MPVTIRWMTSPGDAPTIFQLSTPPPAGTNCVSGMMVMPGVVVETCTHLPPISGPTGMW